MAFSLGSNMDKHKISFSHCLRLQRSHQSADMCAVVEGEAWISRFGSAPRATANQAVRGTGEIQRGLASIFTIACMN